MSENNQAQGSVPTAVTIFTRPLGSGTVATPPAETAAPPCMASLSPTRPPYIPQFTAATQMILKRMKAEPSSLGSSFSSSFSSSFNSSLSTNETARAAIQPAAFDDARRRLVMTMNTSTSLTMQMPVPATASGSGSGSGANAALPPLAPPRPKGGMSAIQRINSGLTAAGKPISNKQALKAAAAAAAAPRTGVASENRVTKPKAAKMAKPAKGRKRVMDLEDDDDDDDEVTTPISATDVSDGISKGNPTPAAATLTTTKSGRQVLKPTTYNPAAMDAATKKRTHYGKRTVEQTLCKSCTRMHSPTSNQMVFCDGCNDGWHQLCHSPRIPDDLVRDSNKAWYCSTCQAAKDRQNGNSTAKKPRQVEPKKIGWADRPTQQKRAYLSTLPQSELVGLLMTSLELHPDLPLFPGPVEATGPTPATSQAPGHGSRSSSSKGRSNSTKNSNQKIHASAQEQSAGRGQEEDDDDYDPLFPPWPEPGTGIYSRLPPEKDDMLLEDDDDYEAFSHILYDDKGHKKWENGIKV